MHALVGGPGGKAPRARPLTEADVLIVGAGAAGCVLAARLTERAGLSVCLVEAGGEVSDPRVADPAAWPALQGTALDWAYLTEPQPGLGGRAHPWPRGRAVGGSTAIHAMGHVRGHPGDFDAWAAAGATGWGWDAMAPHFADSEDSPFGGEPGYGAGGPMPLSQPAAPHPLTLAHLAAGAALGLAPLRDHNGGRIAGPALNMMTIRGGRRVSAADAYLTPAVRARPNLAIHVGALVDRVTWGAEGRADGLLLRGGARLAARRAVILCAGSVGSPAILMRSGVGPGADLAALGIDVRRDAPGVGGNLQDHLLGLGVVHAAARAVPPTTTQHSEALTYIEAAGQARGAPPELVVGVTTVPAVSDGLSGLGAAPAEGYALMFGITHPRSRGRLGLRSADPGAPPWIDPAYLTDEADMGHMLEALGWALALAGAAPYDPWRGARACPRAEDLASEAARRDFVRRAACTHHHPVGTCRMGADDAAPVRPDLSVRGAPGLFVADGSVMPSLTTGPVAAAILALGERAAGMIAAALR